MCGQLRLECETRPTARLRAGQSRKGVRWPGKRGEAGRGGAAKRILCMVAAPSGTRSLSFERTGPASGKRRLAACLASARFHPTAGVKFGGAQRRRQSSQRRCKGGRGRLTGETLDSRGGGRGAIGPICSRGHSLAMLRSTFFDDSKPLNGPSPEMQRSKPGRWGAPCSPLRGNLGRLRHQLHSRNGLCSILTAAHGIHILQSCSVEHNSQSNARSGNPIDRLASQRDEMESRAPIDAKAGSFDIVCDSSPARRGGEIGRQGRVNRPVWPRKLSGSTDRDTVGRGRDEGDRSGSSRA
ncbi:hypothetical protein L1887_50635 [Cichorium endivia]|nr:hypothetical protein L1887_50635 [Cichorium endivia]